MKKNKRGVTAAEVRRLALALPGAIEAPHFDSASFRVNKKIFATLGEAAGRAVVAGVDLAGQPARVEGTDLLARCLLHELDHLDGHLFLDRLSPGERRQALRALRDRLSGPELAGPGSGGSA